MRKKKAGASQRRMQNARRPGRRGSHSSDPKPKVTIAAAQQLQHLPMDNPAMPPQAIENAFEHDHVQSPTPPSNIPAPPSDNKPATQCPMSLPNSLLEATPSPPHEPQDEDDGFLDPFDDAAISALTIQYGSMQRLIKYLSLQVGSLQAELAFEKSRHEAEVEKVKETCDSVIHAIRAQEVATLKARCEELEKEKEALKKKFLTDKKLKSDIVDTLDLIKDEIDLSWKTEDE